MRVFVVLLILYGNTVAPWLCCCAVSRASTSVVTENQTVPASMPSCTSKCCQDAHANSQDSSNQSPKQHHPCPIQELLLLERPSANLERTILDIQAYFSELMNVEGIVEIVPVVGAIQRPVDGIVPTLLMSELRLKYHHAYLC